MHRTRIYFSLLSGAAAQIAHCYRSLRPRDALSCPEVGEVPLASPPWRLVAVEREMSGVYLGYRGEHIRNS